MKTKRERTTKAHIQTNAQAKSNNMFKAQSTQQQTNTTKHTKKKHTAQHTHIPNLTQQITQTHQKKLHKHGATHNKHKNTQITTPSTNYKAN